MQLIIIGGRNDRTKGGRLEIKPLQYGCGHDFLQALAVAKSSELILVNSLPQCGLEPEHALLQHVMGCNICTGPGRSQTG